MPTAILRPNLTWEGNTLTVPDTSAAWEVLDDAVEQPTVPDTADYVELEGANHRAIVGIETVTPVAAVTEAVLWAYVQVDEDLVNNPALEMDIRKADDTVLATTTIPDATAASWQSATYTGEINQADLDGLKVRVIGVNGTNATAVRRVYAAYVVVTYTLVSSTIRLAPGDSLTQPNTYTVVDPGRRF